jgi:hypothetical protein
VRQGDTFSFFCFNIIIDVLAYLINQAQNMGIPHGLVTNLYATPFILQEGDRIIED